MKSREIIEQLAPYITPTRKKRIEEVLASRIHSIQIAVEHPNNPQNALAVVRTAEILGITEIHLMTDENKIEGIRGTTQGAFQWMHIHYVDTLSAFLSHCKNEITNVSPIKIAGASVAGKIHLEDVSVEQPLILLFGNEQRGLSKEAENACDVLYKIPMFGMTESYNLSVSAAISLYDILRRKRQLLGKNSDLTQEQYETLKAEYYKKSVDQRLVLQLLT